MATLPEIKVPEIGNFVYPAKYRVGDCEIQEGGLTKREYFAGIALQGILSSGEHSAYSEKAETAAVEMADRLLKELKQDSE